MARRFHNIGYGILATEGTAAFFASHGLQAQPVGKIGDDEGYPKFCPQRENSRNHQYRHELLTKISEQIRRSAIEHGVPLTTALDTATCC